MSWLRWLATYIFITIALSAHDQPVSQMQIEVREKSLTLVLTAPAVDVAHDLPQAQPNHLLDPAQLQNFRETLALIFSSRLVIKADLLPLILRLKTLECLPEKKMIRFQWQATLAEDASTLKIKAGLFPYDTRHVTYISISERGQTNPLGSLSSSQEEVVYTLMVPRSNWQLLSQFIREGVYHLAIGVDHLLFIVGLLILGGGLRVWLKMITAFTVAHSLTLGLAISQLFMPSAFIVEPLIAASVVWVGWLALRHPKSEPHDRTRFLTAFFFGLIHGFGFAGVAMELELPPRVLGLTLLAFHLGVELGQGGLILLFGPVLLGLARHSARWYGRTVTCAAYLLITTGAYFFFDRVFATV